VWEIALYKNCDRILDLYIQSFCFIDRDSREVRHLNLSSGRIQSECYEHPRFTIFKVRRKI